VDSRKAQPFSRRIAMPQPAVALTRGVVGSTVSAQRCRQQRRTLIASLAATMPTFVELVDPAREVQEPVPARTDLLALAREGMLVRSINTIRMRFHNRRGPRGSQAVDPSEVDDPNRVRRDGTLLDLRRARLAPLLDVT
jgi:hypothetical protein